MSINIQQKLVDLSDFVGVRLDTDKMSVRLKNDIKRMLASGHVEGFGIGGTIARALRLRYALPTMHYGRSWLKWHYMDGNDALFDTLTALHTAMMLKHPPENESSWVARDLQERIDKRRPMGHAYISKFQKPMFKALKLPEYPDVFDGLIEINFKEE
jgi:hypothetical protein